MPLNRKQRRAARKSAVPDPGSALRPALDQANLVRRLVAEPAQPHALHLLGLLDHQHGRFLRAAIAIRRAIVVDDRIPAFHANLAVNLRPLGRVREALASGLRAIVLQPDYAAAFSNLANALREVDSLDAAVRCGYRATFIDPGTIQAYNNLGLALKAFGRFSEASARYRAALVISPDFVEALGNMALVIDQIEPAIACVGRAIALRPDYAVAHNNLGSILQSSGRAAEALWCYRVTTILAPDDADAYSNIATLSFQQGKFEAAIADNLKALVLKRHDPDRIGNLGLALKEKGAFERAADCYLQAIILRPPHAGTYGNLGTLFRDLGRLAEATGCFRKAAHLDPSDPGVHSNLGGAHKDLGLLDQAEAHYRQALACDPVDLSTHSNLLLTLHYSPHYDGRALLEEARRYGERVERGVVGRDFGHSRDVGRRLRIGYVSADLRAHPVGYFLSRVLSAHDHDAVEVTCYSNSATQDAVTSRLRQSAHRWRDIMLLPDRAAAAMIAADGIDILVDLAGHTAKNRLPLFALKPAPIQVSWLGFFGTTGLGAMDYVLGDQVVAPAGDEAYFTEALWRLPGCYLCYDPPRLAVPNGPFPALRNGFVTFGCFNNRTKISDGTVAAWAALLHRVEASRLFLKSRSFTDAECQSALVAQFAAHGIPPERLILEGHEALAQALAAYNRVDIALDPFPFGGGTTTAETLWMGVPLVTLRGERWVGRISASILTALDLTDWVTDDIEGYIDLAARLAADLPGLTDLRASLRHRLETSGFCDGPAFTRSLEAAYRAMWRIWCEGR